MTQHVAPKRSLLAKCPCGIICIILALVLAVLMIVPAPDAGFWRWRYGLYVTLFGWGRYMMPVLLILLGLWLDTIKHNSAGVRPDRDDGMLFVFTAITFAITLHQIAMWRFPNTTPIDLLRTGDGGGFIGAALLYLGYALAGRLGALLIAIVFWLCSAALIGDSIGRLVKRLQK